MAIILLFMIFISLSVSFGVFLTSACVLCLRSVYLLEALFPEPSTSSLRSSMPPCCTLWSLSGSTGMVAAFSGSLGIATETDGSSSREPLSLISDSMGTAESAAVVSRGRELGSPAPDWRQNKSRENDRKPNLNVYRRQTEQTVTLTNAAIVIYYLRIIPKMFSRGKYS